jgi:hypothetical protein
VSGNLKLAQRRIVTTGGDEIVIGTKTFKPRQDASGDWVVDVTMIETRGQGGVFLCAPSDGYELLQGDFRELPAITAEEREVLLGCAWALDEIPKPVVDGPVRQSSGSHEEVKRKISGSGVVVRPGDDYNERGEPRDVLRSHGWTLVRSGDNEHWRRPGKSAGTSATLKDRVFYVFSTNAAPFEAHTGYSPFAVYTLLEHAGDFSAAASALATEGYGQLDDATRGVDLSGFTVTPAIEEPVDLLPVPVCVEDLVEAYPRLRRPVIHGLLREGETMNVIASPKTGKSWLTIDLAIAVATGRAWLGRYETVPGEVLIIDNELHRETSAHRIPKVAAARAVAMREFGTRIHIDNLRGRLRDIQKLEPYFRALESGRYKIIVLDAFYRFMPQGGDENDNAAMANIYNLIDSLADQLRCCFVLIHHSTKGSQSGKSITDVGAGAGAQSRATDTHLVLRPHEESGVVVLDAAVRSWSPIEPTCLRWSFPIWTVDEGLDPTQLKSERPGRKKEKAAPKAEAAPPDPWSVDRFVRTFLGDEPKGVAQIMAAVELQPELSKRLAKQLLQIAEAEGAVFRWSFGPRKPIAYATRPQPEEGGDS